MLPDRLFNAWQTIRYWVWKLTRIPLPFIRPKGWPK